MGISRNCWKAWLLAFPLAASNQVCDDTAPSQRGIEVPSVITLTLQAKSFPKRSP